MVNTKSLEVSKPHAMEWQASRNGQRCKVPRAAPIFFAHFEPVAATERPSMVHGTVHALAHGAVQHKLANALLARHQSKGLAPRRIRRYALLRQGVMAVGIELASPLYPESMRLWGTP